MADSPKKIAEIAEILGIDESECRAIASEYSSIIKDKKIGKVSIYDDNMVDRFRKIADLKTQGLPKNVIIEAIQGGKTLEERAMEDMKKMHLVDLNQDSANPEQQNPEPVVIKVKHAPRSETEEELILSVRSAEKQIVSAEQKIASLREEMKSDNTEILDAITKVSSEAAELKDQMHMLWDQIASLEKYMREAQKKPYWKR